VNWTPAVRFNQCYLSVYESKENFVFLTKETYWLLGRPKRVMAFPMGKAICLSPARKYGEKVFFNSTGQPYFILSGAGAVIGPGQRAYYSHDEEDRNCDEDIDRKWHRVRRRYFYFRVSSRVPATPNASPNKPATR